MLVVSFPHPLFRCLRPLLIAACLALTSTALAQTATPLYKLAGQTSGHAMRANSPSTGKLAVTGRVTQVDRASFAALASLKADTQVTLPLTNTETVTGTLHLVRREGGWTRAGGTLAKGIGGTFCLSGDGASIAGFILRPDLGVAYRFETPAGGETVLREVPINAVLCGAMPPFLGGAKPAVKAGTQAVTPPILNSRPDAVATLYLDFDGATVTDPLWNGGQTIVAAPSNLSAADMAITFTRVKEDYWPFNINVTTDPARYAAAPIGRRMRCIVTPTDTAGMGAGGIAYVGSFAGAGSGYFSDDIPCWAFNPDAISIADAVSHELGHTFGLSHDGRELPNNDGSGGTTHEEYFGGHGDGPTSWGPIMGAPYGKSVTQWSRDTYQYANNPQDDVGIIANATNGFGYVADETGTSPANAPALGGDANGNVNQTGLITTAGDTDFYVVTTTGGAVSINATGAPNPDLDIALTLLDKNGHVLLSNNPDNALSASLSATLARGTYYLQITDSGAADPLLTGYTNYGSIGAYNLTGNVPGLGVVLYPNLAFTTPTGATNALVIANQPGSHADAPTFYATDPLYLDFSVLNNGDGEVTTAFTTTLSVDGVLQGTVATTLALPSGASAPTNDYALGHLSTGPHTITLQTDAANAVAESNEGDNTLSRTINVTVPAAPTITSATTATGLTGTAFSYAITATDAPTGYAATGLPAGLSLKPGTNLIAGTPTAAGTFAVSLGATNILGTGTGTLTLTIALAAPVVGNPGPLSGEVGQPFSFQIPATNSPTGYTAAGLPPTLTLDAATGLISGTPATAGSYSLAVTAGNAGGVGKGTFGLTVQGPRPVLSSAATAQGRVSVPFSFQIVAANSPTGYGAAGLPEGLSVNAATGLISGTPTTVGTYAVTVSAANATRTVTAPLTLTILDAPAVLAWGATAQTAVPADLEEDVVGLAAGGSHSLALREDGTVEAWGANDAGQLAVPAGLGSVVSVSAGALHSLALRSDGTVFAWGDDSVRQTDIPTGLTGVVAVAAGSYHNLALRGDGTVVGWGADSSGQTDVPAGLADVVAIAAGGAHSVALRADGSVVAWGSNRARQLNVPATLTGVRQVAAGEDFTLALLADRSVLAVGGNAAGQTTLPAGLTDVVSLAAGGAHALAVHADGTATAWGSNPVGESTPPKVLQNVALVAAGGNHSLALTQAGAPRVVAALPVNGAGAFGGTAFLFADAVGTGTLSYQWNHAGADLPGETSPFLILDNLQAAQAGAYAFRVTNAAGSAASAPANLTLSEPLPTLTVAPVVKQVPFGSAPFGEFLLTLTGNTSKDLVVNYSVKGSAVNGTDYTFLKGTKKLKAGKTTKPIKVFPLINFPAGTKKTVVLTLLPGDGYTVGTAKAVKVKIVGTAQ